jgi:hypothetical protein
MMSNSPRSAPVIIAHLTARRYCTVTIAEIDSASNITLEFFILKSNIPTEE